MPLTDHPTGNYRFLPGIAPYSCGVVASPAFEIIHVTLQRPVAYRDGFEKIAAYLAAEGRPKAALCAIELRSPRPFSFQGFADFNAEYADILQRWGLFVDGVNPVARTNVAPVINPPSEPTLYGFSFTRQCPSNTPPTFVVAGAGELPEGILSREGIIALSDTSPDGLAIKAQFVMDLMETRLRGLGADWPLVTAVNVYTAHSLTPLLPEVILGRIGPTSMHGVTWHFSRPPNAEIEYEMDVRGTRTDLRCS
ncbi:MAG: RidA family protein [Planctomycetaceae bacterium]|nr:RidA family protein [Planctomycetaceae bacterium]